MDPNANLDQQLALTKELLRLLDGDAQNVANLAVFDRITQLAGDLAERVEALDHWITGGGFLPERWTPKPKTDLPTLQPTRLDIGL